MNGRSVKALTTVAGILAIGEFGSAIIIWRENYADSLPLAGVVFGMFFVLGTWLLRRRRVVVGALFVGVLCLFEVISFGSWTRHNAFDWIYQSIFGLVSLAGVIAAIVLLAGRVRDRASASRTASLRR